MDRIQVNLGKGYFLVEPNFKYTNPSINFGGLFIAMLVAFLLKTHYESGEEEEMPVSPPSFNIPETQENSFEEFKGG